MTSADDAFIAPSDNGRRSVAVAFVPITVAVIGVAAILLGGISARPAIDTMTTGSLTATAAPTIPSSVGRGSPDARRGVHPTRPSSTTLRF